MKKIFEHTFPVSDKAVDVNGHVNNVAYVQWMQDIAVMHSDTNGCGRTFYRELNATWVVRRHLIDYVTPAFVGQHIRAYTWISGWSKISCCRKYKFLRIDDQQDLALAETKWVYVHRDTGRPRAIDPAVTERFELVSESEEP